jgi:uncharacterized membrane protein
MQTSERSILAPIALMATATGARTMVGVTAVGRTGSVHVAKVTAALALLELLVDKLPNIPNRTDRGGLIGRVVAGAFIGATIARMSGRDTPPAALAGALFAFAGAHLSFRFRRALSHRLPPVAAAFVEDAAVLALAKRGSRYL